MVRSRRGNCAAISTLSWRRRFARSRSPGIPTRERSPTTSLVIFSTRPCTRGPAPATCCAASCAATGCRSPQRPRCLSRSEPASRSPSGRPIARARSRTRDRHQGFPPQRVQGQRSARRLGQAARPDHRQGTPGSQRRENPMTFAADPDTQIELLGVTADIYRELGEPERRSALRQQQVELARTIHGDLHPAVVRGCSIRLAKPTVVRTTQQLEASRRSGRFDPTRGPRPLFRSSPLVAESCLGAGAIQRPRRSTKRHSATRCSCSARSRRHIPTT